MTAIMIMIIKVSSGLLSLPLSLSDIQPQLFIISCLLLYPFFCGIVWVRYFYIVSGIIGIIASLFQLAPYYQFFQLRPSYYYSFDTWPVAYVMFAIFFITIDIILIVILSENKNLKKFLYYQKYEDEMDHEATMPCPLCDKQINVGQNFCHYCGGNLNEQEEDNTEKKLEKVESDGLSQ